MIPARIGTDGVDGTLAFCGVQEAAVAVCHPGKREETRLLVKVFYYSFAAQPLCDTLGVFRKFELIHISHTDEIVHGYLNRQVAAACIALPAQFFSEFHPGFRA